MVGTDLETNFKDERLLRLERQNSMENLGDSREIEFNAQTFSAISYSRFKICFARSVFKTEWKVSSDNKLKRESRKRNYLYY